MTKHLLAAILALAAASAQAGIGLTQIDPAYAKWLEEETRD